MLAGVNDQPEHAVQLSVLLRGFDVTLNLIPWNPIYSPGIAFEAPQPSALSHFRQLLVDRGVPVTVRQEKGSDISGDPASCACSSSFCRQLPWSMPSASTLASSICWSTGACRLVSPPLARMR